MAEMQKQGKPSDRKQDEWEQELHPQAAPGRHHGLEGSHPEKDDILTAYDKTSRKSQVASNHD